jgi:hypothetical protein
VATAVFEASNLNGFWIVSAAQLVAMFVLAGSG